MNAHPSSLFGRPVLTVTIVVAALVGIGIGRVALADRDEPEPRSPTGSPAPTRALTPSAPTRALTPSAPTRALTPSAPTRALTPSAPTPALTTPARPAITMTATGDIVMGLLADGGAGFFDPVRASLRSDLVMGNLEQPLTDDTGASKCGSPPRPHCFAFRSPPSYAAHLEAAGFDLVNTANNHAKDFGTAGARNTRTALAAAGVGYTGNRDEITVVRVNGITVAVVGFSPYAGANDVNDLPHARTVIERANSRADLVVVQVHMGAEGADRQHVTPGPERYFGENRGDPIAFSHAVIDAGADLVVGHSPHVVRAMEFYRGRLIAYSLGNFAGGGGTLSHQGVLRYGGILRVTLAADGTYAGGRFDSTYLDASGRPTRDATEEHGRELVARLTAADFATTGAAIDARGTIKPPA